MVKCKKCSFENYDGTKFCQGCGEKLPRKGALNFNGVAGNGMKGASIAPLAAMSAEKSGRQEFAASGSKSSQRVKTVPLRDGSWFCPDCGEHNKPSQMFCNGCGRDK